MVKHMSKIYQQLLQVFQGVFDYFVGTRCYRVSSFVTRPSRSIFSIKNTSRIPKKNVIKTSNETSRKHFGEAMQHEL